jgi:hypothetical protein
MLSINAKWSRLRMPIYHVFFRCKQRQPTAIVKQCPAYILIEPDHGLEKGFCILILYLGSVYNSCNPVCE